MRLAALVPLVLPVVVAAGCGSSGATGSFALKTVKGDWEFNHDFKQRPGLKDYSQVVAGSRCQARPDRRGKMACVLRVHDPASGRTRSIDVVVSFDSNGSLLGWDFG